MKTPEKIVPTKNFPQSALINSTQIDEIEECKKYASIKFNEKHKRLLQEKKLNFKFVNASFNDRENLVLIVVVVLDEHGDDVTNLHDWY